MHRNVAKLVDVPRAKRYQASILKPEQGGKFLKLLRGRRHEAFYVVALTMSLRRGELLGLRWQDIDLLESKIHVKARSTRRKARA